ncbi:hypothetical protein [Thalassospira lucentensis]|jgi:hypothetical protein|tara:strand:- start:6986 stop:7132 length:147 start_codon:yes stop_codon:yes gene_type:complete
MTSAKCSLYDTKDSTRMQAFEESSNLKRMLQEITLTDSEEATVERVWN